MHSLRVKITAITIAAILASLIAFGLAGFLTVGREATASAADRMHLQSENVQEKLDAYLDGIQRSVMLVSHIASDSIDGVKFVDYGAHEPASSRSAEQQARLDEQITQHCLSVQDAFGSTASHTSGTIAYYYCISPDISVAEHGFFYSKLGKVGFEEREKLDARELDPNDREHTTWYYTPIEQGVPTWVGPYKAHFLGDVPTISFLSPIYKSSTLVGVLGMDILFGTLVDQIDSLKVYQSGYACLVDQDGKVLYHPKLQQGETPAFTEQALTKELLAKENSGSEAIRYDEGGEQWQLSFSTLSNGMKLVVTAPVSEVVAPWRYLLQAVPFVAIGILALFVPITLLAVRRVVEPLQQLTVAAHRLAAGDYDIELDYHNADEVGELTNAFRTLRDHLSVYISNLNSQSYIDSLTGSKNRSAYDIFIARLNDKISSDVGVQELEFALLVVECHNLNRINEEYGHKRGDEHLMATSQLLGEIYANSDIFRTDGQEFCVLIQGRDYANRLELLGDFDIMADEVNAEAREPWQRIEVAKGMSTFRPNEDKSVSDVLIRALQRM